MSQFPPDSSVVERVEPSPNFDERTAWAARHDPAALHRHAVRARGAPPAVRSQGPRLVALCGVRERLDRAARAGGASAPGMPACRRGRGDPDINSRSIGIEICNPGHDFGYPDFPSRQIAAMITLCRGDPDAQHHPPGQRRWRIPTSRRAASRIPARNFPGGCWRNPASASGSSRRRHRQAAAEARRQRREGHRVAEDAGRVRLRHRRHRPLRRRHQARSSPPSSATSGRRRSTASPTPRPCRRCGSCSSPATAAAAEAPQPHEPKPDRLRRAPARPLDARPRRTPSLARQSAGRPLRQSPKGGRGGKSGLQDKRCRITSGGAQPQGQCHREQTAAARCVLPRQG